MRCIYICILHTYIYINPNHMQYRAQWAIWQKALRALWHSTFGPLRYNTHTPCVPKRCCFILSIHQLLLTTTTTFSSSSSQLFIPFFLNPQEGVGAIHTHVCKREWVRVCVCMYVCNFVLSPNFSPASYSFCFSSPPDHISHDSSYSVEEPCLVGLPHKSPTFMVFSEKFKRGAERACRCGCLSFLLSPPPVLILFLFNVFHTDSGHVPPSCVYICINVNMCVAVWCLNLNISIPVCIHTYVMCAHTRICVRAHTHILIHPSQDSAYCTLHTVYIYVYTRTHMRI